MSEIDKEERDRIIRTSKRVFGFVLFLLFFSLLLLFFCGKN